MPIDFTFSFSEHFANDAVIAYSIAYNKVLLITKFTGKLKVFKLEKPGSYEYFETYGRRLLGSSQHVIFRPYISMEENHPLNACALRLLTNWKCPTVLNLKILSPIFSKFVVVLVYCIANRKLIFLFWGTANCQVAANSGKISELNVAIISELREWKFWPRHFIFLCFLKKINTILLKSFTGLATLVIRGKFRFLGVVG